jgi:anti-anti-sigma factor
MAVAPELRTPHSGPPLRGAACIEVDVESARRDGYSAVVALIGEHDLATSEAVRVALAPLRGSVLVDLTECFFIDSTIISTLLKKAGDLNREGHRLELRVTPDSIVTRALAIVGIERLIAVRDAP